MKTCLVVDDSRVVRKVCSKILTELGFQISEAGDGKEALNFCNATKPDLILLDWNMPVMNGLEFLKAFRQLDGNKKTKVVLCTTENDAEKIQTAISSGADEYVMKPFDNAIIKGKLEQIGLL